MSAHQVGESEHHESPEGTRWIWVVFWILLIVTAVEVGLGIIKPAFMLTPVLGTSILNITFIVLTLVKAYYIVAFFMHLKFERGNLIWVLTLPAIILIPYLTFIILLEGDYINFMIQ
jgi:cytochrome c oxidase subunit IV